MVADFPRSTSRRSGRTCNSIAKCRSNRGWDWRGLNEEGQLGPIFEAQLSGRGVEAHVHRQRHWPTEQVVGALEAAGLQCRAVLGQREEDGRVLLSDSADEERDMKVIYIAAHAG